MTTRLVDNNVLIPEVAKLIASGHTVTLTVRGNSMRPFIEGERDKALLVRPRTIRVGDPILALVDDGRYVLHRVIAVNKEKITLMGDGNLCGTETCKPDNVIAHVDAFIRGPHQHSVSTRYVRWRIYSFLWPRHTLSRRILLALYRRINHL